MKGAENGDDLILAALTGVDWAAATKPNQMWQLNLKEIQTIKQKKSQLNLKEIQTIKQKKSQL